MYNKTHTPEAKLLISKPGLLNPMYGKTHTEETKRKISLKLSKNLNGVGIFDLDGRLVSKFRNNVEIANYLKISRTTVGKYLNNGLIYKNKYLFKIIVK